MAVPSVTGPMLDVLALLLQAWEDKQDLHGWLIMKSVRRSGPAVYRVLDRLEDAGWVTATWEQRAADDRRPRKRLYRLTPTGVEGAKGLLPVPSPVVRRLRLQPGLGMVTP